MKTTIVPAQITTVEDRIAGNFTFSQLIMLAVPIVIGTALYVLLAPKLQLSAVKLLLMIVTFVVICPLALRVQGKTLAAWAVIYARYGFRPRVYVHTKTDISGRVTEIGYSEPAVDTNAVVKKPATHITQPVHEQLRIKELLDDPTVSVTFEFAQKGGIDVSLTPVKR